MLLHALLQSNASLRPDYADQQKQFARAFAVLRDAIQQHAFPGAALAVAYQGKLLASHGFGRFTYDDAAPSVTRETVFDIASITKAVATTDMAMILFERGSLKLETPVAQLLPEFVTLSPPHQKAKREAVTVRMLLAHSSGLPAYEKLFEFAHDRRRTASRCHDDSAGQPRPAPAPNTATLASSCSAKSSNASQACRSTNSRNVRFSTSSGSREPGSYRRWKCAHKFLPPRTIGHFVNESSRARSTTKMPGSWAASADTPECSPQQPTLHSSPSASCAEARPW